MKAKSREPVFTNQADRFGKPEKIDITKYSVKLICKEPGCMELRYIQPQDRGQVVYCKPHARKYRLASRARRAKTGRAQGGITLTRDTFLHMVNIPHDAKLILFDIMHKAILERVRTGEDRLAHLVRMNDLMLLKDGFQSILTEHILTAMNSGTFTFQFGDVIMEKGLIKSVTLKVNK